MSDCCSSNEKTKQPPRRYVCPENGKQYIAVSYLTILYHIKEPWNLLPKDQIYYFCEDPNCNVTYFAIDGSKILKQQLRTKVGIKETSDDALICYCFGVSKLEAKTNKLIKAFIIEQTKNASCSCTTHNPSGRCCLKDFPKLIES